MVGTNKGRVVGFRDGHDAGSMGLPLLACGGSGRFAHPGQLPSHGCARLAATEGFCLGSRAGMAMVDNPPPLVCPRA
jgi:hypothetical protein